MPRRSLLEYFDNFYQYDLQIATVYRRGYRTERWSYRRVAETACQFARELETRKVERGGRVLIWGENCSEWVAAFWGCLLRGAVVVPMDNIASADFARRVTSQVGATLAVCSQSRARDIEIPSILLETLPEIVACNDYSRYRQAACDRKDMAEIIFTSGTTADPKGVILSHGNILANLEPLETEINKYLKVERLVHPLRFLNLLPLSHVFGQFLGLFVPTLLAATVIFQDALNPSEVVRTCKRERVSVLVAVPRLLEGLKDKIERDLEAEHTLDWFRQQFQAAKDESFLRRWWRFRRLHKKFGWKFWAFTSGGATLDPQIETFWGRLGFVVIQGYGLTETTSLVSVNHPFRLSKGSIGKILPGREIKLDESGEILVRGESVAAGFWQGREIQQVPGDDGWFHTGDLGALDENGDLFFKGRKKNVIVTSEGMNIYPEDLEAALRLQPEVRDCVVVPMECEGREEPAAVLLLRQGMENAPLNPESIVQRANNSLAGYQRMRSWFVWPEEDFPRTSTQKPRVNQIQEILRRQRGREEGSDIAAGAASGDSTLTDLIRMVTGRTRETVASGATLEADLKLSSIDKVELLSALEDRYQVDLNESSFAAASTVGELEMLLHQPRQADAYEYPRWAQTRPIAFLRNVIYYLLIWPATLLLAYPRIRGREHLRGIRGPVLIISNHVTEVDPGFILIALTARLRHRLTIAMAGERLMALRHPVESNWLKRLLKKFSYALLVSLFNVFPLPKTSGYRESFRFAGESIDRGYNILVFPEGELTKDGRIAPFRAGIGVLANKLNVPVVPLRIDGLFPFKQAGRKMAPPGAIRVTIGPPARFAPETDPSFIASELQARVEGLGSSS